MQYEGYGKRGESGSAFVISILILFVLSVLGMALMLTTRTEADISVNYRWGEMAFFNADAALEYGKNVLAASAIEHGDLHMVLPPARGISDGVTLPGGADMNAKPIDPAACPDAGSPGCRDYQYSLPLDTNTTVYIGRVLRGPANQPIQYDFRQPVAGDARGDIDSDGTMDVEGTTTIWVRRPIVGDHDYEFNDRAILTAEGTSPNYDYAPASNRPGSLRRLEMTVSLSASSSIAGDRYSDVTKSSDATGEPLEEGWRIVERIQ